MKRGLVANPSKIGFYTKNAVVDLQSSLTEDDINYFAFYWDEIIVLDSENISMQIPKQTDLIEAGILNRPKMPSHGQINPHEFAQLYSNFQTKTIDSLREEQKGVDWHFHQIGDNLNYGNEEKKKLTVRLELLDTLRIPNRGVHIQEILRFKDDCKDDLNALHEYVEKLYYEVIESKDFNLSRAKNFSLLNEAIQNLDKACGFKWRNPMRMSTTINPEFDGGNIVELINPIYQGYMANMHGGIIPGMLTAIATALPSFIKFGPRWVGFRDKGPKELAYLTKAINKGVIR